VAAIAVRRTDGHDEADGSSWNFANVPKNSNHPYLNSNHPNLNSNHPNLNSNHPNLNSNHPNLNSYAALTNINTGLGKYKCSRFD